MLGDLQIKLIMYAVGALFLAALSWFGYDAVRDHFQDPIKAELKTTQDDRDQYKANAAAEAANAQKANAALIKQAKRDSGIDTRIGELDAAIRKLTDPAAIAQRDLRINAELLRQSAYQTNTDTVPITDGRAATGGQTAGRDGRLDARGPVEPEKQTIRPIGKGEQPIDGSAETVSRWQKLKDLFK